MYKPKSPFTTALYLLEPTRSVVKGVTVKTYPEEGKLFFGAFRTYGGTESNNNGVYSILDTATIETWYRPDIKSECAVDVPALNGRFEILGEPENIELRNQYLRFKVRRLKGGA